MISNQSSILLKHHVRFFASGRINLIGEHTDYNGDHVFPASISFGTYAIPQKRVDQNHTFYSLNFPHNGIIECDLADLVYNNAHYWANFPKGMINNMMESGLEISTGMDILFYGDIANGAGLSSSASIEMVSGVLLGGLFDLQIDRVKLTQLGQKSENDYIGDNSGIDIFNLGSNLGFSVKEMIETARAVTGKEIREKLGERRAGDPSILIASSHKAVTLYGYNH